jgi:hypothetical protein
MNLNRDLGIAMARSPSFQGPVPASHNGLLHRLLEEVRTYHHAQHAASTPAGHREDVDVVISGGGMKGYFVTGAFAVLSGLQSVHVVRMSGASAGAWCAVFMACGLNPVDWADTYYMTRLCIRDGMSIADAYRKFARDILPPDAHKRCSGVVHLSVSVVTWSGIKNLMVSEFHDNEDLIEVKCKPWTVMSGVLSLRQAARSLLRFGFPGLNVKCPPHRVVCSVHRSCLFVSQSFCLFPFCLVTRVQATIASCTIPYFSAQGFGRKFRGMRVLDGGITDNTPLFRDGKRRQIVFQLTDVAYPFSLSLR